MFTFARLRFVRLGRKAGSGRKEVAAVKSEAASTVSSGWKEQGSNGGGGGGGAGAADMGLSLLFLLARTCMELNMMGEVRAQMEAHLQEMRELQLARTTKMSTGSHAAAPGSASTTRDLPPSTTTTASPCRCRVLACTRTDGRAVANSDDDSFIELEGGFGAGAGDSARRRRDSEDGHEERGSEEGVSALELERRLQELLHRRSQERIEELEASLRRAERKLMEKEMEARLWKDTANLALQPPPPPQQQQDAHGAVTFFQ